MGVEGRGWRAREPCDQLWKYKRKSWGEDEIEWVWFRESLAVIFDNMTVVLKMTFINGTAKGTKSYHVTGFGDLVVSGR